MTRNGRPPAAVLAAALLALMAGAAQVGFGMRRLAPPEPTITFRPVQVAEDGYVSSDACKACHPSQYASWHGSYHRTMTQVATPGAVRADFDGASVAGVQAHPMRLFRRADELWAEFDDPDAPSAVPHQPDAGVPNGVLGAAGRITRQVVLVTGSHQQQVYWYRTGQNRLLGQLPGMYLIGEARWIPRRAAFLRPPPEHGYSETGRWNAVCIDCHATNGTRGLSALPGSQPFDTLVADTRVGEFGIACEACHGPGDAHVRANRSPMRRYGLHLSGAPDRTSLLPTQLDARLASQVCGQCHSTSIRHDRLGAPAAGASAGPYRPGRDLDATHFVLQPARNLDAAAMRTILEADPSALRDSFWSDGMVRVSGREYNGLIDSPCFRDARDEARRMSCLSCHAMHKPDDDGRSIASWADTHQLSSRSGDEGCLQCHDRLRANPSAHTRHQAGSPGSACYNCHMPYTSYGLLRALRSHQVSSPTATASVETGRPNACNQCHLDKTLAWTADRLAQWYGTPSPQLGSDDREIPASMLWLLRGDAGQRALMAWSLGWAPAQQVSGTSWMAPSLSVLMNDPYEAVRLIAHRSLRTLPGFADFPYEATGSAESRRAGVMKVVELWRRSPALAQAPTAPALLLDERGAMKPVVTRLLQHRDHRRIDLRE